MPRSTREWAKRKINQVHGNIGWAQRHCQEIAEKYHEDHPAIAQSLITVIEMMDLASDILKKTDNQI